MRRSIDDREWRRKLGLGHLLWSSRRAVVLLDGLGGLDWDGVQLIDRQDLDRDQVSLERIDHPLLIIDSRLDLFDTRLNLLPDGIEELADFPDRIRTRKRLNL